MIKALQMQHQEINQYTIGTKIWAVLSARKFNRVLLKDWKDVYVDVSKDEKEKKKLIK